MLYIELQPRFYGVLVGFLELFKYLDYDCSRSASILSLVAYNLSIDDISITVYNGM